MMGARYGARYAPAAYLNIMRSLSFSYYDQNNSGQMMSKLVSDLFDISEICTPWTGESVYFTD